MTLGRAVVLALIVTLGAARASADVAVTLTPWVSGAGAEDGPLTVDVGQTVAVRIELSSAEPAWLGAAEILFAWDPAVLRLAGTSSAGAVSLMTSGLPRLDPYGLNESALPTDGDAMYLALAPLGQPVEIGQEGHGVLLTTLLFEALAPTAAGQPAQISLLTGAGSPPGHTRLLDGLVANREITGTLTGAAVTIVPAPTAFAAAMVGPLACSRRRRHV